MKPAKIDIGTPVADAIDWMLHHWAGLFDALGTILQTPVDAITNGLEALNPLLLLAILVVIPLLLRRWGIAVFAALGFLLVQGMELWPQTLQSLSIVLVATVISVLVGVPLGVWTARSKVVSSIVRPILDLMQTTPAFVYLIPAVFFFGVGTVPGVVATVVFAAAPAVRLTELGIRQVDPEVVEAGNAFGSTRRQLLWRIQLPLALPTIMTGINQVIMLALSMVVVAGMAGASGLGAVVTTAVTRLDIGAGVEGGLSVVILAIYLDRVTSAIANPKSLRRRKSSGKATDIEETKTLATVTPLDPEAVSAG
ncbi:MAG: ABC transporter permease subunit [Propionibacterium sp.]